MNNYHNPYRNPYPGQNMKYGTAPSDSPSENRQQDFAQSDTNSGFQTQNTAPHSQESSNQGNSGQGTFSQGNATQGSAGQGNTSQTGSGWSNSSWKDDPSLKNMDLKKLAFLSELVAESGSKPLDALLPFLISANKNANSMGLQFNDAETSLLLEVLKKHMSPEEQSRIDMIRKMADMLGKK
ncbi:MAG: hypothetical protein HFI63_09485 [Lachnospiraceae bacterium]|nr:hypothetical protein [Lachnospiraceae bacterium]